MFSMKLHFIPIMFIGNMLAAINQMQKPIFVATTPTKTFAMSLSI
jgi:hypothetical protein